MKLRIGIISDTGILPKYDQELIGWIQNNSDKFDLEYQICLSNSKKKNKFDFFKKFNFLLLRIIKRLETIFLRKSNLILDYETIKFDASRLKKINFETKNLNNFNRISLDNDDINKIKSLNLDIIIRTCGFILDGDVLNVSKFGILSFHHGDNNNYRGGPAGFWEIFDKVKESGFIIQKLDKNLDGGYKLFEGNFKSGITYAHNENILFKNSIFYFQKLLILIFKNRKLPINIPNKIYKKKIFKNPNIFEIFIYIIRIYPTLFKRLFLKILGNKKIWSVIYNDQNILKTSNYNKFTKISNYKNTFLADPFLFKKNNNKFLFGEEYNFKKSKGSIVVYEINGSTYNRIGICLDENFHLSYPYIFKFENNIYMLPETAQINEIRLYKCIDFPMKWKFFKTLKKDIFAVDNMIFYKNNYWWLFTNIANSHRDRFSNLDIFYCENPLTDKWKQHDKNPIFVNIYKSRNAGIIINKNDIFRINQSPSFYEYGYEINLNKIVKLTPENYEEVCISNIKPDFKKNLIGIHHLNKIDEVVAMDFCENSFFS